MHRIKLSESEVNHITALVKEVANSYKDVESSDFLEIATVYAQELPRRLRVEANQFRLQESDGVLLIQGYGVDDRHIGPTPSNWRIPRNHGTTIEHEIYFFLCSSLFGDAIAWATQQDGRIMHDIHPIAEDEDEQLGSGSSQVLTWHTEDAFHPLRTDYLGLFCLRNHERVETTYFSLTDLELPDDLKSVLTEKRYPIRPDRSHLPENFGGTAEVSEREECLLRRSYSWIQELDSSPPNVSAIFGDLDHPYIRLDPYFMSGVARDPVAKGALDRVVDLIDRNIVGYAAAPGEVLLIDNYKAVHGRRAFSARYDGTDRWFKRLNLARDLRKSRSRRPSSMSRTIY